MEIEIMRGVKHVMKCAKPCYVPQIIFSLHPAKSWGVGCMVV